MGFYGNITNTSRTQFQFDKIYPNRKEMEQKILTDGIYLNRYVLIEYDSNINLDNMKRVWIKSNGFHISNSEDDSTLLKKGNVAIGELVYTAIASVADNANPRDYTECIFYICTEFDKNNVAQFDQVVDGSNNTPLYTVNYNIDVKTYGAGRGYDSTVWQKVFVDNNEKYVMIAELNTVVPTFDVTPDAPTMNPIVPHFDTQSTDVYYKLHWQAPWGFRVKETEADKSDETTIHTITTYDPETGKNTTSTTNNIPAAIYYNDAGFAAQVDASRTSIEGINKHSTTVIEDEIKVEPTGKSGNKYNDHNGQSTQSAQFDIQEMTINLPSIGNMMSDAWDIIHGPRRNDDMREIDPETGDYVASLKGRLDSIDAIADDEIPVKRHDNGQLIGSKVNGGKADEDDKTGINDDAWIETIVDAATNTISIHHKFNRTKNGNTFIDLRAADDWGHDTTDSIDMNNEEDNFDIVTPIIDDMGHIVGENTQTVTLPYGFKTIKTNGRSNEVAENATGMPAAADIVADNTKDELTINSGNKWIRIDTDENSDSITIRHDVHNTSSDENTTDWTQTEADTTVPVVTYNYDEAGHYVSHHTENYKLPFGYGKIKGDNGNTAATATYDELTFASDEWLTATVSEDKVTYSHDYPKKVDDTTSEYDVNGNGDTIILETLKRDDKGHVIKVNQNTVTLPYGYKTFTGDTGSSSADNTQDTMSITGDSWVQTKVSKDKIEFSHIGPVAVTAVKVDDITPKFGETFDIIDWYYDEKGHKSSNNTHTVKIPLPSLTKGTGNVVTGLALNAAEGALTETKNNISNLLLTDYSKKTNSEDINSADALGDALSKLQTQIHNANDNLVNEKSRAEAAEAKTLQDAKAYTDTVKANLLGDGIKDTFNTLVEIQNWIEGDGVNTTELTQAIADEATARANAINALGSAAYREEVYFVSKTKYDLDMSTKDAQINGLNIEAKRLTNEVIALQERLTALENLIQSQATE